MAESIWQSVSALARSIDVGKNTMGYSWNKLIEALDPGFRRDDVCGAGMM